MDTSFERGENSTNEWYTPKWIIDALGKFDLDPCAPMEPIYKTAERMVNKETDGLSIDWGGVRVWLNPPYSHPIIDCFIERMALNGNGIALIFNRMDSEMWHENIFPFADAMLIMRGRVKFLNPGGEEAKGGAGCGSVLVAYGKENADILENCGIKGKFIRLQ